MPSSCGAFDALLATPGLAVEDALVRDPTVSRPGLDPKAFATVEDLAGLTPPQRDAEVRWLRHRVRCGVDGAGSALAEAESLVERCARNAVDTGAERVAGAAGRRLE